MDDAGELFRLPNYLREDINKVAPEDVYRRPYTNSRNRNAMRLSRAQVAGLDDKIYEENTYGRDPRTMDGTVNNIMQKRNSAIGAYNRTITPEPRSMLSSAGNSLMDNRLTNVRNRIQAEIQGEIPARHKEVTFYQPRSSLTPTRIRYIPVEEPVYETAVVEEPLLPPIRASTAAPISPTKTVVRRRRAPLIGNQAVIMPNALEQSLALENRALYEK